MKKITFAITGASGMPYARSLLQQLLAIDCSVNLLISKAAIITLHQELELSLSAQPDKAKEILVNAWQLVNVGNLKLYTNSDWYAPMASGSSVDEAMVVCPCSMTSLAKIATGLGDDLIHRAADVIIKEQKKLILLPREMPFSALHLEHMLKLARLGVCIMPPIPGFYHQPTTITDLVNFVVARVMDQLTLTNTLIERW